VRLKSLWLCCVRNSNASRSRGRKWMIDYAYPIRQSKHHKRSPQGHISRSSNGRLLHRLPSWKQDLSVHSQVAAVPPLVYTLHVCHVL
jgi:hypothetical protein